MKSTNVWKDNINTANLWSKHLRPLTQLPSQIDTGCGQKMSKPVQVSHWKSEYTLEQQVRISKGEEGEMRAYLMDFYILLTLL